MTTCSFVTNEGKECSRKLPENCEKSQKYCWQHHASATRKINIPTPKNVIVDYYPSTSGMNSIIVTIVRKNKDYKCRAWFEHFVLIKAKDDNMNEKGVKIEVRIDQSSMTNYYAMVFENGMTFVSGPTDDDFYTYEFIFENGRNKKSKLKQSSSEEITSSEEEEEVKSKKKTKKDKSRKSSSEGDCESSVKDKKSKKKTTKEKKPKKKDEKLERVFPIEEAEEDSL